jgi:hypothetical protein
VGEGKNSCLKLNFDGHLRLEFRGAKVTSDAGLLAVRELDDALGLTAEAGEMLRENRTGRNVQHELSGLLRQSVYARLAGYEDVNDQEALTRDPAMRAVVGIGLIASIRLSAKKGSFISKGVQCQWQNSMRYKMA